MTKMKKGLGQIPNEYVDIIHPEGRVVENVGKVIHLKGPKVSKETEAIIEATKAELIPLADVNDKELVAAFVKDPEMKKQANLSAFEIQKIFTNWFSVPQLVQKFKTTIPEAAKQIEMLILFNVCVCKVEKGKAYFKIDISQRAQRSLLLELIAEKEGEILFLKEKLGKLD